MKSKARTDSAKRGQTALRRSLGKVLVPTDFSAESLKGLYYATALLREEEGKLHLVYVYDAAYSYAVPSLLEVVPVVTTREIEMSKLTELQKLAAHFTPHGEIPSVHVRAGRAFDQICQVARKIEADLIVVATHGHTGLKHLMLGSTAERVVQHAPCPVLVVREHERELLETDGKGGFGRVRLQKILVPVDFSEGSRHAVRYALALARARNASLVLLHATHVIPPLPTEHYVAFERVPSPETIERAARRQMNEFVRALNVGSIPCETVILFGRPAQEICASAEAHAVDLIVTSTHGVTGFAHVVMGSTAEHVVRYAHCPVLVIPPRDRQHTAKA